MEEELEIYLQERGIPEAVIKEMKEEKIDMEAIKCMDDVDLSKYLKHVGDRYSVKHYCSRTKKSLQETFAMKLKQRLCEIGENKYTNRNTSKGNSPRTTGKLTRKVSIGWICNGKLIRPNQGGGVREIDVSKSHKKPDLLKIALDLFFPEGKSTKGCLDEYSYDLYDFKNNTFDDNLTVEQIYEVTKLTRVRFFLITTCIVENDNKSDDNKKKHVKKNKKAKKAYSLPSDYSDSDSDFYMTDYVSFDRTREKTKKKSFTTVEALTSQLPDTETDHIVTKSSKSEIAIAMSNFLNDQATAITETNSEISEILTLLEDDTHDEKSSSILSTINTPVSLSITNDLCSNYFEEVFEGSVISNDVPLLINQSCQLEQATPSEIIVSSDLKSELKKIQSKINFEETVSINACRENTIACIARALKRSSFSPLKKLDVLFVDSDNTSEGGIDAGGPTRELWRLALTELKSSNIFTGREDSRNIVYNLTFLEKRKYFEAAQIISLALVHGGPGPNFLSNTLFNCIAFGVHEVIPTLDDISTLENFREILDVSESNNLTDLQSAIANSNLLMEIGVTPIVTSFEEKESILKGVLQHLVIHRPRQAIEQFIEGMKTLDVISLIRTYPDEARLLFCYVPNAKLNAACINDLFFVILGVEGTKERRLQNKILLYWRDYLQNCEDGDSKTTLENLLSFATGADKVPPLGFPNAPTIEFLYDDCRFPKANTCALVLYLPTVELDFDKFVDNMDFGILNGLPTFGMP